jgi:hypothetical protein
MGGIDAIEIGRQGLVDISLGGKQSLDEIVLHITHEQGAILLCPQILKVIALEITPQDYMWFKEVGILLQYR